MRSWTVSLKMIESPVIFTTKPLNTGSFSRRKYALFKLLTTTAIIPESDFTTPLRLIWSMARQRLPVLQPEPSMLRLTTGLIKGSRRLVRLICLGASDFASLGRFWSSTAIRCLGSDFLPTALLPELCLADTFFNAGLEAGLLLAGVAGFAALPCEPAKAALESAACFCWTGFSVFLVLSMTAGFCPQAVPATIPKKRIPVVSFIGSPASAPRSGRAYQAHLPPAANHD